MFPSPASTTDPRAVALTAHSIARPRRKAMRYLARCCLAKSITLAVSFTLASMTNGKPNAVTAAGQTVRLPAGKFNRLYLLVAANGDQNAEFKVGDKSVNLKVQDWTGFVGQWDDRIWKTTVEPIPQNGASLRGRQPTGSPE